MWKLNCLINCCITLTHESCRRAPEHGRKLAKGDNQVFHIQHLGIIFFQISMQKYWQNYEGFLSGVLMSCGDAQYELLWVDIINWFSFNRMNVLKMIVFHFKSLCNWMTPICLSFLFGMMLLVFALFSWIIIHSGALKRTTHLYLLNFNWSTFGRVCFRHFCPEVWSSADH